MKIAVVSGGVSAKETFPFDDDYNYFLFINDGFIHYTSNKLTGYRRCVFCAKDPLMIRKHCYPGIEVWTNIENRDLVNCLGGTYTTDLSKHGYNYTATATLFEVYNQFRFVDCVDLFGFDMKDGSAISNLSSGGEDRWRGEREEFNNILKQFEAGGLQYRHIKTKEDLNSEPIHH